MALNQSEKNDVIRLLGWPASTIVEGSSSYNRIITQRVSGLSEEAETDVRRMLERIEGLDLKLDKALDRLSLRSFAGIELNPEEVPMLRKERNRLIKELSQIVDVIPAGGSGIAVGICV